MLVMKVLNFPRLKSSKNRHLAPIDMICNKCKTIIYKGKKLNYRKKLVENESSLGLPIHRFYMKCPWCKEEIVFKTDPINTNFALEDGATRIFRALRSARKIRTFVIGFITPFNMKCTACRERIYKGNSLKSRIDIVENEDYFGSHYFRYYIKCVKCSAEIVFMFNPIYDDYIMEDGATRFGID